MSVSWLSQMVTTVFKIQDDKVEVKADMVYSIFKQLTYVYETFKTSINMTAVWRAVTPYLRYIRPHELSALHLVEDRLIPVLMRVSTGTANVTEHAMDISACI